MIRGICLSAAAIVMLAAPALAAESACMEPTAPKMPNGRTAPAAEVIAAANAVKAYVADSDAYQQCLNDEYNAIVEAANADKKPVDPKLNTERERKINANQTNKEKLGQAYNKVATDYRSAHPR